MITVRSLGHHPGKEERNNVREKGKRDDVDGRKARPERNRMARALATTIEMMSGHFPYPRSIPTPTKFAVFPAAQ
jgi:hypothetical protein